MSNIYLYFTSLLIKALTFLLFWSFFVFSSHASENNIKTIDSLIIPDEIPFFDLKNKEHYFDEYDGKTLLVVFWASWCSACTKEMPELDNLQKDFRKLPFKVIALSQDYKGMEAVEQFYKNHELRYLEMFYDQHNNLFKAFNVVGIPSAFLVDVNGKVVANFAGTINWHDDKIREAILKYIPGSFAPKNSSNQQSLIEQNSKSTKDKKYQRQESPIPTQLEDKPND